MSEYVIGVDAGGTKSHLALFDTTGTLVDFGHWGPLNHETFPGSYAQFKDELEQFVTQILSKHGLELEQVSSAAFGIAGVDTKTQHGIISEIIEKQIGFKKFILANDAFLGIHAGSSTGTGVCAINGTGCTLAGINKEGKMFQIGGVGFVSDDYGGGGMMGRMVVSSVYSELFRKGEPTCLTADLFEKLGISSKYDFVDKIYEKIDDGSFRLPSCSRMLFMAVVKNDKVASNILRNMGISYANGISGMIEELDFRRHINEDINVIFAGSNFVKSEHPLLLDTIKEKINADNPDCKIKYALLNVPPVAGAVIWAFNNLNGGGAFYDKVCAQLNN